MMLMKVKGVYEKANKQIFELLIYGSFVCNSTISLHTMWKFLSGFGNYKNFAS